MIGRAGRIIRGSGLGVLLILGLTEPASPTAPADAAAGRAVYDQLCGRCHGNVTEAARGRLVPVVMLPPGPNLTSVYGREAGTVPGYRYSEAFLAATRGLAWDEPALDRWLADSQAMARGSYMFVKVPPAERTQVIAYLRESASVEGGKRPGA